MAVWQNNPEKCEYSMLIENILFSINISFVHAVAIGDCLSNLDVYR